MSEKLDQDDMKQRLLVTVGGLEMERHHFQEQRAMCSANLPPLTPHQANGSILSPTLSYQSEHRDLLLLQIVAPLSC
ncbi:hypothetical protein M407DRAFT_246464 [Tulasnella calospora MUT 4182]|uniref:Uncharacterized protein n=1 Tax=Tulasnella calospora MUT 4182 TaxID=1051891 RepID=A0A0C3KAR8_9AGAM|nr:hypothetical protein M407DRAFT_246464 [Tulasnella calospora MUT 4182]